jgi:hypothetical protein
MSLWKKEDTEAGVPAYLSDEDRKKAIFVDDTEAADADTKAKGITGPGWWLYESRKDSSGTLRHYAEKLISMRAVASVDVSDRIVDTNIEVADTYVLSVTTAPVNRSVTAPAATTFGVTAAISSGGGAISYQWQVANAGSKSFASITNGGVYTTATTATLNISNTTGLTGKKYRVVITATNAVAVTSNYATLTVA